MDRLLILLGLAALLALAPLHSASEEETQSVFFSLLFPQLMPEETLEGWFWDWNEGTAGEAVML